MTSSPTIASSGGERCWLSAHGRELPARLTGTFTQTPTSTPTSTPTWTPVASRSAPRELMAAATDANRRIYAIGGANSTTLPNHLATVEAYSVTSNSWTPVNALPAPVSELAGVAASDGRVLALGGINNPSPNRGVPERVSAGR